MDRESIIQCLKYGEASTADRTALEKIREKYPWFSGSLFALLRIKQNSPENPPASLPEDTGIFLPDTKQFCKAMFNCVDFNNTGKASERGMADFPIIDPSVAVAGSLLSEYDRHDSSNDLIDKFLNDEMPVPVEKNADKKDSPDTEADNTTEYFTETLAKIYINQGLYEKAITTYFRLSLKYPEKSSYFATQIEKIKPFINK